MSQRWSRTRSGSKYVNLDTLSPLQGVADGHNRLSGDLQHNGATADQGMQMAAEVLDNKQHWYEALDIQYQAMEQELERYRTVMADSMARMKAQNKAARDSRQAQLEAQEKSLAEFRQKQAEEEARNQEARQQAFRQLVSPDQSLSWDYRISGLHAQQVQLLAEQEAMASHHPSSPIEELTSLKHPIEGVPGEVPAGGTRFPENIGTTTDQGLRMPSHLLTSRQQFFESVDSQHEELMKGHKLSLEKKELSNRMTGVEDRQHQLSGNLHHVGATADRGRQLASQLSASHDQFYQSMESQQEEMMTVLAQKQKSFWESMRCQIAVQNRAIAAIKPRQNDALKELQDQDTGWQMTRQTLSPVPSLSRDYRDGALRAQHDQLLAKQETLGSLHTSTPVEERTQLEHPIEGVPGGVSAGGTSFQENSASRRTQPWRSVMMPANLIPLTQCTDTPYQEAGLKECHGNASDQMGTGYPFRDAVDPSQYRITRSPHHQEELTELGQDAQSSLRHPMQGVSAGITEPQDSVFQLEAVLQKCHVDRDLQDVSAGTIAPQSPPSSAHHHGEHSVDDLVVCHPEPDMVTGGQTNLRSSTNAMVELESGGTDDPDPVMDSGASVASPTKATSPLEAARELATHPQSLSKDPTENFTAEQVGDFRPHYQRSPRLLKKENASRQDRKQAKKEFSTQLAGQAGSVDSPVSSSDDHYRQGQRKGRKHQKGSRRPRRATGISDASLDRNWRQKDNRHTLKVSKVSSCDYSGRQNGWDFDMVLMLQDTEHVKVTATGSEEFWWDACEDFEEELMDGLKRESCEQVSTTIKDKAIQQESLLAEWYELEKSFDELELTKDDDSREDFRILKVDEEQLFLEWSLIEKALDAESRLERKMGGEEDSGYLVDMNCKIRAIISDAQCRI